VIVNKLLIEGIGSDCQVETKLPWPALTGKATFKFISTAAGTNNRCLRHTLKCRETKLESKSI
jgi:hypothetical protein